MSTQDNKLDIDRLQTWIGRHEVARDVISPELSRRLWATLDVASEPKLRDVAPLGIQWCLAPPAVPASELGSDGHPRRGGFLPPVPLPRRMWAGGELILSSPLRVGDVVERKSRIDNVELKSGRSGPLCFVTVRHEFIVEGTTAVSERHDIVYRGPGEAPKSEEPKKRSEIVSLQTKGVEATPTLLFRYSALTFNGHRIHYDRSYCLTEENYPGLVVHGPLQATLLLHFAKEMRGGTAPLRFSFRSVGSLFDGDTFFLNAADADEGLRLWTSDGAGRSAMLATAAWS